MSKEIAVRVRGTCDYLQNRRPPKSEEDKETRRRSGEIDRSKDAEKATYRDNNLGCYIPNRHFEASMVKSAVDYKIEGKRGKTYKDRINAAVRVEPEKIPFSPSKKEPDRIDGRWGRIPPKTGPMVWIQRPCFHMGWEVQFKLIVLDDQIPLNMLREILKNSGEFYGIGDWLPRLGKFKIVLFEEKRSTNS